MTDIDCNGVNARREMLKRGLAWVYIKYARDIALFDLQTDARRAHLGLWAADNKPLPPWAFRHGE